MKLEEAIGKINEIKKEYGRFDGLIEYVEAIDFVINHITNQDKLIGNIFSYLDDHRIDDNICDEILNYGAKDCIHNGNCAECIKQYFEKKAEEIN